MTTSTLQNGLRRALTTLESSLNSSAGSPPTPTVDLDTPEENLAARLGRRLRLVPRIDVLAIARGMATVEQRRLPEGMDGVCFGLKAIGTRPRIIVTNRVSPLRQRFTLAHEIGHIVIPWHTGAIIDDLNASESSKHTEYRRLEAEANRFASELLMPSDWVRSVIARSTHLGSATRTIAQVAEVSLQAALYKAVKLSAAGHVAAIVRDGVIIDSEASPGSWGPPPAVGRSISEAETAEFCDSYVVTGSTDSYHVWRLRDRTVDQDITAPLETLLDAMLASVPEHRRSAARDNVHAIIGYTLARSGAGRSAAELRDACVSALRNRHDREKGVATVAADPRFVDYVVARVAEHVMANEAADVHSAMYGNDG